MTVILGKAFILQPIKSLDMIIRLLFLLTLFFSFSVAAQIDFEAHVTVDDTGGTNNPTSVFAADLDGDGDMDMISASVNDDKIAWYKNIDGQGTFGPQQIISEIVLGASSVFTTDINGDGDMDILYASSAGDTIAWLENIDGQGSFGPSQIISTLTDGASSVYAVDVDNDGDMDVFSVSSLDDKIAWYENTNGQGSFGAQQIISTNFDYPLAIVSGDIDSDGDLDILSGSRYNNSRIAWFKNTNGQGNFIEQQTLTTDITYCRGAILADIDGDGDLDIAAVSRKIEGHRVIWFENTNGQGNFSNTPNIIFLLSNNANPETLYAADFDNDNDVDIAIGTYNNGLSWFKNNGSGSFGAQQTIDNNVEDVRSLFPVDIDNDGDSDLLIAAGEADRVAWHENTNGQGNFGPANELAVINGANGPYHLQAADIDGDGDKDIIAALNHDNRVVWQENLDGQGTFSELKTIGSLDDTTSVFSGDLDGDGKMDILASGYEKLVWYRNLDGLGNFGAEQIIYFQQYSYTETIYTADIDNDGDLDVFSFAGFQIFWQENNGTGSFGPAQILSTEFIGCDSMVAVDIDNDGDKDLVASDWAMGKVVWFENMDGQGNFGSANIIDTLLAPDQVDVGDMDNDGDMDIVTLDYGNDEVMWYENLDGQGSFGSVQIISSAVERPFSLKTTDIDDDGDMDVLATSYSTASLWLFQNDGNGNFNNGQSFTSEVQAPIFVTAADFNGDDKMDVLVPSYSNDEIIWFENHGPLGIEENTTNLFSIYPNPTNGLLYIQSKTSIAEITIFNNLGQLFLTSENKNQIIISNLREGIYFVKIKDENGQTETKKVMKI